MERKKLLILLALAVTALALATWISLGRAPDRALVQDQALVPELKTRINELTGLRISRGPDTQVSISLQDGSWVIAEKGGYPADAGKLREALLKLADARVIEQKTSNPAMYSRLGVEAPEDPGAQGVLLGLEFPSGRQELVVGKRAMGSVGTYVRGTQQAQSLLVDQALEFDPTAQAWMQRRVLDVPATEVEQVQIRHPDGQVVNVARSADGSADFSLQDIPEGREMTSSFAVNGIGSVLVNLQLDDVRPAQEEVAAGQAIVTSFLTSTGLQIEAWTVGENEERWVSLRVSARNDKPAAGQDGGETAGESAQERARTIQQTVQGWQFQLPAYKLEQLTRRMEDLLKPLE